MPVPYAEGIKTLRAANPTFQGSDEQLYQQWLATTKNREAIEPPGKSYSLSGLAGNVAENFFPAVGNAVMGPVGAVGALSPPALPYTLRAAAKEAPAVIKGLWQGIKDYPKTMASAAANPGQVVETAKGAADWAYEHPVEAASMASPVARGMGLARTATALDLPAAGARLVGWGLKKAAKGWMGGVAKIPDALKKENPFDIREVMLEEGVVPTMRGADKASRAIQAQQAQVRNVVDRNRSLIERKGPAGAIETPTPPPGNYPVEGATGSGTAVNPNVAREQFGTTQAIQDVPATGTGWATLRPQSIPVGTAERVSGTAGTPVWGVRPGASDALPAARPPEPAVPVRTLEGPILSGTEELRAAVQKIDPIADTDNAMRNAFQKELAWVESQAPTPMQASRYDTVKSQLQDQVSYGVRQKELSNETLAKKKLAAGFRRVENEAIPAVAPMNQRIGRLVAAEEAAAKRGQAYQNLDPTSLSLLLGGGLGMGAYYGGGQPLGRALALGVTPWLLRHPTIGGYGSTGMWKGGKALGALGEIPSALGISAEELRREAEASMLSNGSTEKP